MKVLLKVDLYAKSEETQMAQILKDFNILILIL